MYVLLYFTISRPTCLSFYTHLNVYIISGMRWLNHNSYVSSDTHGLVMELQIDTSYGWSPILVLSLITAKGSLQWIWNEIEFQCILLFLFLNFNLNKILKQLLSLSDTAWPHPRIWLSLNRNIFRIIHALSKPTLKCLFHLVQTKIQDPLDTSSQ